MMQLFVITLSNDIAIVTLKTSFFFHSDYQNSFTKTNGIRILGALLSQLHASFVDASLLVAVQVWHELQIDEKKSV